MNEAWTWRPLGDLFEIGAGKTMSAAARNGTDKTPFLRTSNVLWDEIDLTSVDEMSIPEHELPAKLLRRGDVLVCEGGDIGRAAIWNGEVETMSFQNHLHRLRPIVGEAEPRFYVFFLQSAFTQLGIYEGAGNKTTIPNLSRSRLASLHVPQPPLGEQQAISTALGLVRDAIRAQDRIVTITQGLKRAAMQSLFTRGLRGEAQKETEIGPLPESWILTPCDQIFRLTSGKKRPATLSNFPNDEKPFPVLGGNGVMGFASEWYLDVSQALIIGRVGEYCGSVHIASGRVWVTDNALYAKEWHNCNADIAFIGAFLDYYNLNRFKRMAGQPLVTQGVINEHKIPLPHIDEQREIAAILDAIDRKIDLHGRKRAVLGELFKALLHKLMTGEIRVAHLDHSALVHDAKRQGNIVMPKQSEFFQQFVGDLLDELKCQVQEEPPVGENNKADFLATTPDGDRFYVEATEVTSGQYLETPPEEDVVEKLNGMCHNSGIFWYSLFVRHGELRQKLAKADLFPVKEWVEGLSTQEPKTCRQSFACHDRSARGVNARCRPLSCRDDVPREGEWVFEIEAMPRSEHMRGVESAMFAGFGKGGAVDSVGPLVRAIKAKALQHKAVNEPLLVAINDKSMFPAQDIDVALALFGWEQYVADGVCRVTPPIGMPKRRSAWGGRENTKISAVLLFTGLTRNNLPYQEVCLYANPWARYPIPCWLKRTFPHAKIQEKSGELFLHRPSERHLNSVRGLPVEAHPHAKLIRALNENVRSQGGIFRQRGGRIE